MAVAITQTADPAGVAADGSFNTTYSTLSIGTATDDRVVVVVIGKEVATRVPGTVTLGGLTMVQASGTTFGSMGAWLYYLSYPTGTTATVVIAWGGAVASTENHIAVYTITDGGFPPKLSGSNSSTDMDASSPLTTGSVTIATNGGVLAIAVGATDTVVKTWANITVDLEEDAGGFRFTTAKRITSGTVTITCTGTTNLEDGAMAYAIFEQAALPPVPTKPVIQTIARAGPRSAVPVVAAMNDLFLPPFRPQ